MRYAGQLALNTFSYSFTCFLITSTDLKDVLLGLLAHVEANNLEIKKEFRFLEIRIFDMLGLEKVRFVKTWTFGE